MVSRDGWVLVDDTYTTLLLQNPNGWDWVAPRPNTNTSGNVDWYLFMHGLDYRAALYDFTKIALPVPLPPRYMFGSFWSRYWAFNDKGEMDIVRQYEQHDTPLDVMVIDMDWHETFYLEAKEGKKDQAGNTPGWTGWTWDSRLFPRPKEFLTWVHNKNIKVTLNLHPASGVQPHEKRYPEMAKAMGIDPATRKYVPFNITDINFTTNLMDIMLRPLEKEGTQKLSFVDATLRALRI
jgi:alpha-glucosidase (family GH31 glycosyl hydrolase)